MPLKNASDYLAKTLRSGAHAELDDGTCIGESVVICRYMESIQSEPALFGATGVEAAKVEMWQRRAELGFVRSRWSASQHHRFFKDREPVLPNGVKYVPSGHRLRRQLHCRHHLAVALDFARMVKVVEIPGCPISNVGMARSARAAVSLPLVLGWH